jgi:IS5 family transposase
VAGTPAEIVLRMLVLKHLFDWSYDDLEREVRANLVYRAFTRIHAGEVPDAKTILKIANAMGPDTVQQLHLRVVEVATRAGVTRGRRLRIDTTVVETNVHYPTDSSLLRDGVRVLTRTMQRASATLDDALAACGIGCAAWDGRVLAIGRQARSPETRDALVRSYRRLTATTRAVVRDTHTMVRRISQRCSHRLRASRHTPDARASAVAADGATGRPLAGADAGAGARGIPACPTKSSVSSSPTRKRFERRRWRSRRNSGSW